jgi:hypothetical protein
MHFGRAQQVVTSSGKPDVLRALTRNVYKPGVGTSTIAQRPAEIIARYVLA